jgi:hypothetical protein
VRPFVGAVGRERRERVDLRVGKTRPRELAVVRRVEDPVAPPAHDLAVPVGDDRADGDRAGSVRLPRQLEHLVPDRVHRAILAFTMV